MRLPFLFGALALGAFAYPAPKSQTLRTAAVPFGRIITSCTVQGTIALTFDDGPFRYTDELLDTLADAGAKATFFVCGNNWAPIKKYNSTIHRMANDGHQIASHTWSHPDLTTLSADEVLEEMTRLEDALLDIIGKFPTYMRPPFLSVNNQTLHVMKSLGYHVIDTDLDTKDWENSNSISVSVEAFTRRLDSGGTIVLAHDVHEETVQTLAPAMIELIKKHDLRTVTVGECLGDPEDNWYRTSRE